LDGCVLTVVWVPECVNDDMCDEAFFKMEASVFDYHHIFDGAI